METERIPGLQKAAIFLFAIGEELASQIVKKLDEEEIKRLGGTMAKVSSVTPVCWTTFSPSSANWPPLYPDRSPWAPPGAVSSLRMS